MGNTWDIALWCVTWRAVRKALLALLPLHELSKGGKKCNASLASDTASTHHWCAAAPWTLLRTSHIGHAPKATPALTQKNDEGYNNRKKMFDSYKSVWIDVVLAEAVPRWATRTLWSETLRCVYIYTYMPFSFIFQRCVSQKHARSPFYRCTKRLKKVRRELARTPAGLMQPSHALSRLLHGVRNMFQTTTYCTPDPPRYPLSSAHISFVPCTARAVTYEKRGASQHLIADVSFSVCRDNVTNRALILHKCQIIWKQIY